MTILEKLQRQTAIMALFFAVILIVPIEGLLYFSTLTEAAISSLKTTTPQYFFPTWDLTGVAFFILPIIYCIGVSLLFHPKRIVSPLFVQIGTVVVFSIVLIANVTSQPLAFQTPQEFSNLFGVVAILGMFAIVIGLVQEIIVRWVVGLNFDSVDRASFTLDMSPNDFLRTTGKILHDVWDFNRRKDNGKAKSNVIWVLKTHDRYGNSIVLTVGHISGNEDKSIIATVAYHSGLYGISTSETASRTRKSLIRDINGELTENAKPNLVALENVDDTISARAYVHAISRTVPKTEIAAEFFKNVHWYYLFAMVFTAVAFVSITVAYSVHLLDASAYIGSVVVIVIALVFEFGASLREEWSHQELEELD